MTKITLNPDKKIVENIFKGLLRNKETHGEYYCPCRVEHTKENICPCAYHEKEIEEKGVCHCGLFVKGK